MAEIADVLVPGFDTVWRRLLGRLDGLTDDEYLWEPAPVAWTLRPDGTGRWLIDGEGGGGPAPVPVPISTIAWRMGHIGLTLLDYGTRLAENRPITLEDAEFGGTADEAIAFLQAHYGFWRGVMTGLDDWTRSIGPAFGAYAEQRTADLVLHVLDELTHHAAEIGVLRDLYPYRA
ncbi:DinB family protein [Spirillospora sp. NPDC127200]